MSQIAETSFAGADFDPTDANSYAHWANETVRFSDLDLLGHVNNNATSTYFETARVAFFAKTGLYDPAAGLDKANQIGTVVVRICVDFRAELLYPATVKIGTRTARLGTSSFSYRQGMFWDGRCVATAKTTNVVIDLTTRRPMALTDDHRAALLAFA